MTQRVPDPVDTIKQLRDRVLTLAPAQIGLSPSAQFPHVWGVLMELGYAEALVTLLALADGTVSLYLGHGGGVIGGGQHENVRRAAQNLLRTAEGSREQLAPTTQFPMPALGRVRFHVLTFAGALAGEGDGSEIGEGRHSLSALLFAGHGVITELRKLSTDPSVAAKPGPA